MVGWSNHFEFTDEKKRRVRCDFFSRPPRVSQAAIDRLFESSRDPLLVIDVESLIRMKQTQRAKDYAVIGELAARLPPAQQVLLTTDPDRLLDLAAEAGAGVEREAVRAALTGDRDAVVVALAREQDQQRRADAAPYIEAFNELSPAERRLPAAHAQVVALAGRLLPTTVEAPGAPDADAE